MGFSFMLDVNGPGWQAMKPAIRFRGRLMHPKAADDLNISDDELRMVFQAHRWMAKQVLRWLAVGLAKLNDRVADLQSKLEKHPSAPIAATESEI